MMALNQNHPMFHMKAAVASACSGLFAQFGLSYFQYLRCYHDGAFSLISNDLRLIDYMNQPENKKQLEDKPVVYSAFDDAQVNQQQFWFLWEETLPEFPVQLAKEKFNIHHGITLMRREKNYYDMIGFAMPARISNPFGFYANILGALEGFIEQFEMHEKEHITMAEKHRIIVPTKHQDPNRFNLCLKKGRVEIQHADFESYLTLKELHCVRRLNQGMSSKAIAKRLHISPRTVETYLQRVKHRTGLALDHPSFLQL